MNKPNDEELIAYMEESAVSANGAYEQSPVVLMVDDAAIGTLGNFSASIGKAKSKKTFNVTAIAASALKNGTVLKYRSSFPEDKRTVPEDKNPDNLIMLALRKYAPPIRLAIVEQAIGTIPDLGLVIIDGIRDFLYDINSPSEATETFFMISIPPVKRPILFPDSCNGRMTDRFIFIPFSIRTRMTRMPVVTSARN